MPEVATKVIASVTDEMISLADLAEIIALDPAISARVIGLANSAYFAREAEITTVEGAIIRSLGLDLTRGVAIGMACSTAFDLSACPNFRPGRFWAASLCTSAIAEQLASASPLDHLDSQLCTLAGLLDRIGYLGLAAIKSDSFSSVLSSEGESLGELVWAAYGCSHHDVALALAQAWGLPPAIQAHFSAQLDREPPKAHPGSWTVVSLAKDLLRSATAPADAGQSHHESLEALELRADLEFLNVPRIIEISQAAASACG